MVRGSFERLTFFFFLLVTVLAKTGNLAAFINVNERASKLGTHRP